MTIVKLYLGLITEYLDAKSKDPKWTYPVNEIFLKYLEKCFELKYYSLPYRFIQTVSFNSDLEVPITVNQNIYNFCFKCCIIHGNYQLAYEYILAYFACVSADEKGLSEYNTMYKLFVLMNICIFGKAKSLPHFLSKSLTQELAENNENILIFCENYENHVINLDNIIMLQSDIETLKKTLHSNDSNIFNTIYKYILEERYIIDCLLHCSYCYISMKIETFLDRININFELFNNELAYMKANNMISFTIDKNIIKFKELELDDVLVTVKKDINETENEYLRIKNKVDEILSTELISHSAYEEDKKNDKISSSVSSAYHGSIMDFA